MFWTIVIGLLVLMSVVAIGVGLFVKGPSSPITNSYGETTGHTNYSIKPWAFGTAAVALGLAAVITVSSSLYNQDPGEAKVLRSFTGEVVGTDTTEGLGFKAPWVEIITYDIRNQAVSYVGDGTSTVENSRGEVVAVTGAAITAQTKDGATASMDMVVLYSIDPASVEGIYEQFGSQENFESKLVQNAVKSVSRTIPLQYSTAQLRLEREDVALKTADALNRRWEGAGVSVEQVDLQDIRYSSNVEGTLEEVQAATNRVNTAKAELDTARINADKTRVEAQAMADYDQIVRCGAESTTTTEMVNGVETTLIEVTPLMGDDCENRLNDQVLANKYIDALREMGSQGNLIVVPQGFNGMLNMPTQPAPAPATSSE